MNVALTNPQWMRIKYTLETRGRYHWVLVYQPHHTLPEELGIFSLNGWGEHVPLDQVVQDLVRYEYSEWLDREPFDLDTLGELAVPPRFRRELLNHIRQEFDRMYGIVMHEAFKDERIVEEVADV